MGLHSRLAARAEAGRPVRVGVIGAGKFATMFLAQAHRVPGLEVAALADLDVARARAALEAAGHPAVRLHGDGLDLCGEDGIDVVVEATGDPVAGTRHALAAIGAGRHLVMVNVEADALVGPELARRARAAGLVYAMAYGDQPALIAELVDWAGVAGFPVVAAGKGTKYLPAYDGANPDTVWAGYGIAPERAAESGMNPKMFCSFLDGTKSAIEMAALANATGLGVPRDGLAFPPAGTRDLATVLRPREEGGVLERRGTVEVVSSLRRDGAPVPDDLRWGVFVVVEAPSDYARACFADYGLATDPTGRYAALWRPAHLIGLELGVSVAKAALLGEATGGALSWRGDVAAVAKRDLAQGETLDGEGGFCVWGRLVAASRARAERLLPIGLAARVPLVRPVPEGRILTLDDVGPLPPSEALTLREAMLRAT